MKLEKKLNSLINNEMTGHLGFRDYSLKNIISLLNYYNKPHKKIKTIHISGTNGKGSVAHMLHGILVSSGYKTGLYTSPHLLRINERIRINAKMITDKELNRYLEDLLSVLKRKGTIKPTYFDILTLFAFRYFYESRVDIAILETGLGGRLDSTNVVNPLISIITDISLDHVNVLGKTISEITYEKAGIIKKKSKIVTSNVKPDILNIIDAASQKTNSKLFTYTRDFRSINIKKIDKGGFSFDFLLEENATKKFLIENISLNSICRFQVKNASLAIASSLLLDGFHIRDAHIKRGILRSKVPGRLHVLLRDPLIIFDPAHNPVALNAVIKALSDNYPDKKHIAVIAFMKDKNYRSMFKQLDKFADVLLYYELDDMRSLKLTKREYMHLQASNKLLSFNNLEDLLAALKGRIDKDSLILFSGTFRLYEIAKKTSSRLAGGTF
jgi:dihydrofolate synthase/folylpolyglutamate synthase